MLAKWWQRYTNKILVWVVGWPLHRYTYTEGRKVGDTLDLTKWVNDGMSRWIGRGNASLLMRYSWRYRVKARITAMLQCN